MQVFGYKSAAVMLGATAPLGQLAAKSSSKRDFTCAAAQFLVGGSDAVGEHAQLGEQGWFSGVDEEAPRAGANAIQIAAISTLGILFISSCLARTFPHHFF